MARRLVRAAGAALGIASAALLLTTVDAVAQQGVTTGSIAGRVIDTSGEPLADATIRVENVETGTSREVLTNADGRFTAGFLQPGRYSVRAEFPPLEAQERGPVRVSLGDQRVVEFVMQPLEVEGIVARIGTENQVDVSQGGVVELVNEQQIENLPTLGRDFTDFIKLSGLVSPAPEVGTGGQFSLGGGRTSATNIQIDGTDANNSFFGENRGSSRIPFTFSLESIKEFQIITNGFDVEFGNYTGGVINAVTKGGTNEFRGSAFYYLRDESLTADDFTGLPASDFRAHQFGARLSGPIVEDKAHFFISLDAQQKNQPVFALVPERYCPECLGIADSIQRFKDILRDVYGFSQQELDSTIGTFEETEDELAIFGRIDWQMNERHTLTLRHNYADFDQLNDRVGNEEALTHGAKFQDTSNSFVSELTSVLGDRGQGYNTARFQFSYEDRPRPGNSSLPEIDVEIHGDAPADAEYGGDGIVFRNRLEETKLQFVDNLTWQLGETSRHTVKLGTNNILTNIKNLFYLLGNGNFNFDSLEDLENRNVDSYTRFVREDMGTPFADFDVAEYSFYAQDEWQASDRLMLLLGLRYDTNTFADEATFVQDVQDVFGLDTRNVPEDRNNVSPRVAFTYDIKGDETSVLRGGAGLLYGRMPFVLHGNVMQTAPPLRSLFCFSSIAPEPDFDFFRQSPTGENNPFGCTDPDREGGPPEFSVWGDDFENPESWKVNLGYEQVVGDGWRLSADGLYGRTTKNFNVSNVNLNTEMFRTAIDNRPVFVPANKFSRTNFNFRSEPRLNPEFGGVYLNESNAESEAWSMTLKAGRRFAERGLSFQASYTHNRIYDNSSFFCCTSNEGFRTKPTAGNPNFIGDPGDEDSGTWGRADFERRQVWVLSGTWGAPWGIDVSGIWRSQSGTPWTLTVNGDVNGDGEQFNDRAPVFANLQFQTPEDAARWDQLLSAGQFVDESGNVVGGGEAGECLREALGGIVHRNSCSNPWFHSVDMHVAKGIDIGAGREVELIVDLFNVLNGLNEDWGTFKAYTGGSASPLRKRGYDQDTNNVIYSVQSSFGELQTVGFTPFQFQAQVGARVRF